MTWHIDLKQVMVLVSRFRLLNLLRVSGWSPFLSALVVFPTNKCDLRCYMCPLAKGKIRGEQDKAKDLDFDILKRLIDEVSRFWLVRPRIHLSGGGEPTMYGHFSELLSYCKSKKMKWSMTTNGYALGKYYRQIVDNNCNHITISVHGLDRIHDRIVGIDGCFERVISNIKNLDEYKKDKHTNFPMIALNCVMSRRNVRDLREIFDFFRKLPVHSITFQHLMFKPEDLSDPDSAIPKSEEETVIIKDFIEYVKTSKPGIRTIFLPSIKMKDIFNYYNDYDYPFGKTCIQPWMVLRVYPGGVVATCNGEYKTGNVKDSTIRQLWNSRKNVEFRNKLRREGLPRICQRCCVRQYY